MYEIKATGRFKKDLKVMIRRGYNMELLDEIVSMLANGENLPEKNRDHNLSGQYSGKRECHITPDWLLIYEIDQEILYLYLTRTGTVADFMSCHQTALMSCL